MLEAGLPVLRSLTVAISGMKGGLADAFKALAKGASSGEGLAETMARYPKAFSQIDVLVVEAGDRSGNLPACLKRLSDWHAFCDRLRRIFTTGMMLPLMLIFLAAIFDPAPALFRGLINISQYLFRVVGTLVFFFGPAAVIFAVVRLTPKRGFLRRGLDGLTFRIPVLGKGVQQLALSRYCHVFHMLFKGGVPITQCAKMASEHTGNAVVTNMLAGGTKSALAGSLVSEGFSSQLPQNFVHKWQIGEKSGELDNVVGRLAKDSSETAEKIFAEVAKWIPILIYWLVCGFMVVSISKNFGMIYG
jgi:type IV pilus assembly protein PilC